MAKGKAEVLAQAERYLDWNANARHPHKNKDAGFRNWLKDVFNPYIARQANGHAKPSDPSYGPLRDPTEIARDLGLTK